MSTSSPAVINMMVQNGAIPLPITAAQSTPPGASQPPVNPVSPKSYSGVVQASGSWAGSGPGTVTNPSTGVYAVQHNLGLGNHSISPAVVAPSGPCGISVVSMDGNSFSVQIVDGNLNPIALPWGFMLSTVG